MRIIVFHAHIDADWFGKPLLPPARFLEAMDHHGVERACIFTLMGFYGDCRAHNERLAAHARAHPERLMAFATVDPKLGPAALEDLQPCLDDPIFAGLKFHPWLQAFAPSMVQPTMNQLMQRAAQKKWPVMFHDGTPPYSTTFQIAALARDNPETVVVLGHAGLSDYVYAAGQLAAEIPNLYLCFCAPKAGELPYLVRTAGAHKVLFGSDLGFGESRILEERLDEVLMAGLDEATLDQVLYRNAARLLGLKQARVAT